MKKLILAIINNEDSAIVASELTKEGFFVTKLSTSGGYLMVGNTTLLIGTEAERVDIAKKIIKQFSATRKHKAASAQSFGRGYSDGSLGAEVTVSGATVFVLDVAGMEKY